MIVALKPDEAGRLNKDTPVSVLVDGVPDAQWPAHVVKVHLPEDFGGPWKATLAIDPPAPDEEAPLARLVPGMMATAKITWPARKDVLLVPNGALTFVPPGQAAAGPRVFVVGDDGTPRRMPVAVGADDGQRSQIMADGLEPGAQVIIGSRSGPPSGKAKP
jgi:HlyD family secretion protein